ncbi:hypothetical protein U3516DRAFT_662077 [Neocallimastix sp. 'constans']
MKLEADNPTKVSLKDLTRCLIRCDIDQKRYYDERLEKRDSRQDNRALVAALLGIYSTEYRVFINEREKEDNNKRENGKKKHKQFSSFKEKGKEDSLGKGKAYQNDNPTSDRGNFRRPSNNNPLPTTMLVSEVPKLTREVPENFVVLNGTINNPRDPTRCKEVLICLDPCSSINIIPPKLVKELKINVKEKFTSVKVIGNEPTLRTITDKVSINIPLVVKGSHDKIAKPFTFTTSFNITEHFEHTILLGQNFLEKHRIYTSYDNHGKRTTKIVNQGRDRLDYPTKDNTCLITVNIRNSTNFKELVTTKGLQELLVKPAKNDSVVTRYTQSPGNQIGEISACVDYSEPELPESQGLLSGNPIKELLATDKISKPEIER